jgi:hypothetical protein
MRTLQGNITRDQDKGRTRQLSVQVGLDVYLALYAMLNS